ncbi:MAG: iron-containing redox enzyme family protein [Myxococcales bacterium]
MVPTLLDSTSPHQVIRALIHTRNLDEEMAQRPNQRAALVARFHQLSRRAWSDPGERERCRLEAQRCLYELNRLRLYWGDDPNRYANEESLVLAELRMTLESHWANWLARRGTPGEVDTRDAAASLRLWAERDSAAAGSPMDRYFADDLQLGGYRRLLEIGSLAGLVEASQLARAIGGAPNGVQAALARIFVEEYGAGRLAKKHSSYFARMLEEQELSSRPEAYFEEAPWEILATINHGFYLAENKRHYLRFCGAYTYAELATPAAYWAYAQAARRLGVSNGDDDYWSLHLREDGRHGRWMLEDVALPLLTRFPERRHEVLQGYLEQRVLAGLVRRALFEACRKADGVAHEYGSSPEAVMSY